MKLILGSDHAGFRLRGALARWAADHGHEAVEVGAPSEESFDYPDAADALVPRLLAGEFDYGVLVCGSGVGISIRANRYPGIRAAHVSSIAEAQVVREHNHANIIAFGQRFVEEDLAKQMLERFLATPDDMGERHVRRIIKLDSPLVPTNVTYA